MLRKFLGKFKRTLISWLVRFSYLDNITENDKIIDERINSSQDKFLTQGYSIKKNFLNEEEIKIFQNFFINKKLFDEKFIYLMNFVENKFKPMIKNFLGDDFILMGFIVARTTKDTKSLSDAWHTDSVGHKINFHICVEGDGSIPTLYLPESHKKKYFPSIIDEFRDIYKISQNSTVKNRKIAFEHTAGDCTLFDANGKHIGVYKNAKKVRKLIFLEFMNKKKYEELKTQDNKKNPFRLQLKMPYRDSKDLYSFQIIEDDILHRLEKFDFFSKTILKEYENKMYFQKSVVDI